MTSAEPIFAIKRKYIFLVLISGILFFYSSL